MYHACSEFVFIKALLGRRCPDSSQFYFDELPGEKHLCYVPNTEHSLKESNAVETLIAFHHTIVHGTARPEFVWKFDDKNKLIVQCKTQPKRVVLWQALNADSRDFRVDTIGKAYQSKELKEIGDGIFECQLIVPEQRLASGLCTVRIRCRGSGAYAPQHVGESTAGNAAILE